MDFGISDKVAFVSGGSKGIGRKVAEMLAREGCKVVIAAREPRAIEDTVTAIKKAGGQAAGVSADLTSADDIERAVAFARSTFGPPDIAISNVHGPGAGNFFDLTNEQFTQSFQEIALSVVNLTRLVVPHMKEKRWGRLINIGSGAAKEPPPELRHLLANVARASVVTMQKSLANEFGPFGITVNTIGTGWIGTDRMYAYLENEVAKEHKISKEQALAMFSQAIPMRRPGKPEEIAAVIVFLCSDLAGYLTGEFISVDGGHHHSAW